MRLNNFDVKVPSSKCTEVIVWANNVEHKAKIKPQSIAKMKNN